MALLALSKVELFKVFLYYSSESPYALNALLAPPLLEVGTELKTQLL